MISRVVLLVVFAVLVAACAEDPGATAAPTEPAALPDWLRRVYPAPGQELTVTQDVQVQHNVTGPEEGIRLWIDGVDVTTYALEGRGELVYDPDREPAEPPVLLDPGRHQATAQRVRLDAETGQIEEVLQEYTWSFTVL